jgi:Cu-Zn family superoxide dismutase
MMRSILSAALLAAALSPASALAADSYDIMGKDGQKIGSATLTASPHGVLLDVATSPGSLPAGRHGLHFHETADCSDTGQYKKSGSHAGHAEGKHGLLNPNGPEPGDLPNLDVAADGSAKAQFFTQLIKMDGLKDANGSALLIHAQADDQTSQPIGKSGDRVACAAIK